MRNHPDPRQLAEILVDRSDGQIYRGSGYLVAPGWLITADHTFTDAKRIRVWLGAPSRLDRDKATVVNLEHILRTPQDQVDLALVPVPRSPLADAPSKALFGRLDRASPDKVPVVSAGFPKFKLRPAADDPTVHVREVHFATGTISAGSNKKTNTYEFIVDSAPADTDPKRSPWEGMSGAAVFASGRLIGVVGQHFAAESTGVLTVRPVTALFDVGDIARWREALAQLAASADEIAVATMPSERELTIRRAQRVAAVLSPNVLVAREDELALLYSFVGSTQRFLWLQGAAFAGKTALLAWFTLHQHVDVDVAACFLRRTDRAADPDYALAVLCEQLAVHAGDRRYQRPDHVSQMRDDFFDLLDRASRTSVERGHRLLVLIDGADEYQVKESGLDIDRWLPSSDTLPDNAWLVATSRAGVKIELPEQHPLRRNIYLIDPSPAAKEIERIGAEELEQVRQDAGGLIYELLGLLTVAQSGLTCRALTDLVRHRGRPLVLEVQVSDILNRNFSRLILKIPDVYGIDPTVLAFAHDTLLESARKLFAGDLPVLSRGVIEWANDHAGQQWPPGTPTYLLLGYPQLLKELHDTERLYALATDTTRRDRLCEVTAGDSAALTEIGSALRLLVDQLVPDLARICLLARTRDLIAGRNWYIPMELLGAWVYLGQLRRAQVAAGFKRTEDRAHLYVSSAMAKSGHINQAVEFATTISDPAEQAEELATIAGIVAQGGDSHRANEIGATITDAAWQAQAFAAIAQSVAHKADSERATEILSAGTDPSKEPQAPAESFEASAEEVARGIELTAESLGEGESWQGEMLTFTIRSEVESGRFKRAAEIAATITDAAWRAQAFATVAEAVAQSGDTGYATEIAERAAEIAAGVTDTTERARALGTIAEAVAQTGHIDRAAEIAATIPDDLRQAMALATIAESAAQASDAEFAAKIAAAITDTSDQAQTLAKIAGIATQAGDAEHAGTIAERAAEVAATIPDDYRQAETMAIIAESVAAGGDAERAVNIAERAVAVGYRITAAWQQRLVVEKIVKCMTPLADTGRARGLVECAVEIAASITDAAQQGLAVAAIAASVTQLALVERAAEIAANITDTLNQGYAVAAIAESVAQTGDIEHAAEIAATITDISAKAKTLETIAGIGAEAGDTEHAGNIIERAVTIATTITDAAQQAQTLSTIAESVAEAGDTERAVNIAERALTIATTITDAAQQADTLATIAGIVTGAGDVERAVNIAERAVTIATMISDDAEQARALAISANAVAETGHVERALEIALTITDAYWKVRALTRAVGIAAQNGRTDHPTKIAERAAEIAAGITEATERARALDAIAEFMAETGHIERAVEVAATITESSWQNSAFATIAESAARAGDIERAAEIASHLTDSSRQAETLTAIAESVAQAGDTEYAVKIAATITDTSKQGRTLATFAKRVAQTGDTEHALDIAAGITDVSDQAGALATIAESVARAGNTEYALEIASSSSKGFDQDRALATIASIVAEAGDIDQAEEIARRGYGTDYLVVLAAQLAAAAHVNAAKRILARAWIGARWATPLDALPSIDLPAAYTVAEELG